MRVRHSPLGALTGFVIGLLWAWLYWESFRDALVVAASHAAAGAALARPFQRSWLPPWMQGGFAAVGAAVGALWCAPVVLFAIDVSYYDLSARVSDLALVLLVVAGGWAVGAVLASPSLPRRVGTAAAADLLPLLLVTVAVSSAAHVILADAQGLVPRLTAVDRLAGELRESPPDDGRLMVLGIDGAGWDVLLPMVAAGKAPNLAALMERGQYGVLESVRSPSGEIISPTVWSSIFTGTDPEDHGVTAWARSDSRNRDRKALWTIFNEFGRDAVVVNVPGTFPPEVVRGIMVSGFPIPRVTKPAFERFPANYGWFYSSGPPAELETVPTYRLELAELGGTATATPSQGAISYSPIQQAELPILAKVGRRYGVLGLDAHRLGVGSFFLEFLRKRGFPGPRPVETLLLSLVDGTDDGKRNYDSVVLAPKHAPDRPLARLRPNAWTGWIPLTVHGASLITRLKLVELSEERVALFRTPLFQDPSKPVLPFTYPEDTAAELAGAASEPYVVEGMGWYLYEDEVLLDALYEHIVEAGAVRAEAARTLLDSHPDWGVFVHLFTQTDRVQHPFWRFHRPHDYGVEDPALLRAHRDKVTDVFARVDELVGEMLARADEETTVAIVSDHGFTSASTGREGVHALDGIYVVAGPNVGRFGLPLAENPGDLPTLSALSVTPTLLYLMGYPVARDWDGEVAAALATPAYRAANPIEWVDSYESPSGAPYEAQPLEPSTIEQLRSLGYVP